MDKGLDGIHNENYNCFKVSKGISIKKFVWHNSSHLQSFNNPIYYVWFNKRLIPLNIDNNVKKYLKLLECLIAAFGSCKLITYYVFNSYLDIQKSR